MMKRLVVALSLLLLVAGRRAGPGRNPPRNGAHRGQQGARGAAQQVAQGRGQAGEAAGALQRDVRPGGALEVVPGPQLEQVERGPAQGVPAAVPAGPGEDLRRPDPRLLRREDPSSTGKCRSRRAGSRSRRGSSTTKSKEVPFNYRVFQDKSGTWKVYDVVVENVSLVMNYRSQFNEILAKGTPDELLEILRKKVKGQKT